MVMAQVSRSSADKTWISERASRRREGNAVGADSVVMDVGHLSVEKEIRLEQNFKTTSFVKSKVYFQDSQCMEQRRCGFLLFRDTQDRWMIRKTRTRPTLVSLATDIAINICLRSGASLQKATAIVAEKKCSNQRHVVICKLISR